MAWSTLKMNAVWVFLGGGMGSMLRYGLQFVLNASSGPQWPWGTWMANVVGSFLMGLSSGLAAGPLRLAVTTGVLGGFTTYSAFNQETLNWLQRGQWTLAVAYIVSTLLACWVAGAFGMWIAQTST